MKKVFGIWVLATIASVVGVMEAKADVINLTGSYNYPIYMDKDGAGASAEGGGVLPGATLTTLDGTTPIHDLYCVELFRDVGVPGSYNTNPTNDGILFAGTTAQYTVSNAGEIAWLMVNIARGVDAAHDTIGQEAVQAAIWTLAAPGAGHTAVLDTGLSSTTLVSEYNADLALANKNSAPVSDITWFSNYNGTINGGDAVQALIGNPVPEPSTFALLGLGGIGLAIGAYRRRSAAAV